MLDLELVQQGAGTREKSVLARNIFRPDIADGYAALAGQGIADESCLYKF
jgi:hypothetical protein